jgi:hypothetical protein
MRRIPHFGGPLAGPREAVQFGRCRHNGAVDLVPLVSTAVGAAVALLGTLLADTLRNRGQRDRDNRSERRVGYLEFVVALDKAHGAFRHIADAGGPDVVRQTRAAFTENRVYETRERLIMTANPAVIRAAEHAFVGLLGIRDAIRAGARLDTSAYHDQYHIYAGSLWALRRAIREDLGASDLKPQDLDKSTWDTRETCLFCTPA